MGNVLCGPILVGLDNLGSTDYMNATLQCYYNKIN